MVWQHHRRMASAVCCAYRWAVRVVWQQLRRWDLIEASAQIAESAFSNFLLRSGRNKIVRCLLTFRTERDWVNNAINQSLWIVATSGRTLVCVPVSLYYYEGTIQRIHKKLQAVFIGRPSICINSSMGNTVHLSSHANSITPQKKYFWWLVLSWTIDPVSTLCCTYVVLALRKIKPPLLPIHFVWCSVDFHLSILYIYARLNCESAFQLCVIHRCRI